MKILINASNLKKGGAMQVTNSFLEEIKNYPLHDFYVILSPNLKGEIDLLSYPSNFDFTIYDCDRGLFKNIMNKNKFLDHVESIIKPDCVFSIFGPTYWKPKVPHLVGVGNGWWYNPDSPAWNNFSFYQRQLKKFKHKLQIAQLIKEGDFFVVETEDGKKRINKYLNIGLSKICVVNNTYNQIFNKSLPKSFQASSSIDFKLITVSAFYKHKNLGIIPSVVNELQKKGVYNVVFYLTIPHDIFKKEFTRHPSIKNLGAIKIQDLPTIYSKMDAVFLPTLLETFSASYPEAMKMGKPIITSDLSFAHDICGHGAEYFDPFNPIDIAEKIEHIIKDEERRNYLISEGFNNLKKFDTSRSRAKKYLQICKEISK